MTFSEPLRRMRQALEDYETAEPMIRRALDYTDTHTIEDVWAGVFRGDYQVLVSEDRKAAAVLEVNQFPRAKHLHVFLAGGEMESLLGMVETQFRPMAGRLGCTAITCAGRRGWERALKGWRHQVTGMELRL